VWRLRRTSVGSGLESQEVEPHLTVSKKWEVNPERRVRRAARGSERVDRRKDASRKSLG
jgi:hypothetical protein